MSKWTKYLTALSAWNSFNASACTVNYLNSLKDAEKSDMQFLATHVNDILQRHITYKFVHLTDFFGIKIPLNEFYVGLIGASLVGVAISGYCAYESAVADRRKKIEAKVLRKYYSIDNQFGSNAEFKVELPRTFFQ